MPKQLDKIEVLQGNGNGKTINLGSNQVLNTTDLVGCIAVLIVDKKNKKCHMIHSDVNGSQGIGGISLEDGIKKLGLSKNNNYEIGLLGGMNPAALENKQRVIQQILPKSTISTKLNSEGAFLAGEGGFMAPTRTQLAQKMGVENLTLRTIPHSPAQQKEPQQGAWNKLVGAIKDIFKAIGDLFSKNEQKQQEKQEKQENKGPQ